MLPVFFWLCATNTEDPCLNICYCYHQKCWRWIGGNWVTWQAPWMPYCFCTPACV